MLIFLLWLKKVRRVLKLKVNDRARIRKCKNIFSKVYTEDRSREIVIINSALKTNPWTYKIKKVNGEKQK